MSNDKLMERLEKLLNLSTSDNPNEAAVALAKAQALMEEHKLTLKDLENAKIKEAKVKSTQSVSKPNAWETGLVQVVADAFGCSIMWDQGHSNDEDYWGRFILVGEKNQVKLAEYTVTVLLRQLLKSRARLQRKFHDLGIPAKVAKENITGFCLGWVLELKSKIRKFANAPELQTLIDQRVNQTVTGGEADVKKPDQVGALGYHLGRQEAKSVELQRPMTEVEKVYLT